MFKLILIEDDIPVLEKLDHLITNTNKNFQVIASFTHPLDAIDYAKNNEIDAVITDIQLPDMSGIELCEYFHDKFPDVSFAMISAYDYFEYAQKAIDLKVVCYLLKPITKAKLEICLDKLSHSISSIKNTQKFTALHTALTHQQTIINLLSNTYKSTDDFFNAMQKNGVELNYNTCKCASISITIKDTPLSIATAYSKDEMYQAILNIVSRSNNIIFSIVYSYFSNMITVFCFCKKYMNMKDFEKNVLEYLEDISFDLKNIANIHIDESSLDLFHNIDEFKKNQLIKLSGEEHAKNIMSHIYDHDTNTAIRCAETIKMIFKEAQAKQIYTILLSYLSKFTHNDSYTGDLSCDELLNTIVTLIDNISHNKITSSDEYVIEKACEFIRSNYMHDITLNDVADHVFLTPAYFSFYFKKKTGEKYNNYLTSVRLKKACELLEYTNISIPQIAEMSGFCNKNYFHKIFKNSLGATPIEYRTQRKKTKNNI